MIRYKVLEAPDSLFRCPSCKSKHLGAVNPVMQRLLDVKGLREVVCKRCGTSMPWLNWRDYGRTSAGFSLMERRQRKHPPWETKTPLWAIPRDEDATTT